MRNNKLMIFSVAIYMCLACGAARSQSQEQMQRLQYLMQLQMMQQQAQQNAARGFQQAEESFYRIPGVRQQLQPQQQLPQPNILPQVTNCMPSGAGGMRCITQ